ncbi:Sir2 histone deacetylase Hst2 [Ascosphaera atra]|nr:Sir2 histone deacetylase Hst2 [Ascosphaera atra]
MRKCVEAEEIPHCPKCGGLVKPDIVFFGESLPEKFFDARTLPGDADLCIVMGTSLSVQPFGSLPYFCSEGTPRLLINLTEAGDLGSRPDDVLLLKDCDAGVRQLAKALGWEEDLQKLWWKVNPEKAAAEKEEAEKEALKPARSRDEELQDEVDRLAKDVDQALQLSKSHEDRVREELGRDAEPKSETELESTVKREIEGAKGPEKETEAGVGKVEKGEAAGEKEGKQTTSPEKTPSGAQQQTPPPRETEEDARRQGIDPHQTMMREEPNKS